ncbi:MAG: hypothetical protein ACOYNS_07980 [Bacteroidota bacterium]
MSNIIQGVNGYNAYHLYHLCFGLLILVCAGVYHFYYKPAIVIFDEYGISGRLSFRKVISVPWTEMTRLEMKLYAINLWMKNGGNTEIDLSGCTYKQHHELKPKIIALATHKNIDVHAG